METDAGKPMATDIHGFTAMLQTRDEKLAHLERQTQSQQRRIIELEFEVRRAQEDKDAALKTLLLLVKQLDVPKTTKAVEDMAASFIAPDKDTTRCGRPFARLLCFSLTDYKCQVQ